LFVHIHCGTIGEGSRTLRNSGEGVEQSGRSGDIYAVGVDAEDLRTRKNAERVRDSVIEGDIQDHGNYRDIL